MKDSNDPSVSAEKSSFAESSAAESGAISVEAHPLRDAELLQVGTLWPALPSLAKSQILTFALAVASGIAPISAGNAQPVSDEVFEATLPHLPAVVADMVGFQRLTGCLPSQTCLIRPCDVDLSTEVWVYRPLDSERVVLIGVAAQAILRPYLDREPRSYCFRPVDSIPQHLAAKHAARTTPMTCGNTPGSNRRRNPRRTPGERYTTAAYRRAIARAADKAFPHPTLGQRPRRSLTWDELKELKRWQRQRQWSPNQLAGGLQPA